MLRRRQRQFRICRRIAVGMLMLGGVGVMVIGYAFEKRLALDVDLTAAPAAVAHWQHVQSQAASAARRTLPRRRRTREARVRRPLARQRRPAAEARVGRCRRD